MDVLKRWSEAQPGGPGRPFVTYYDVSTGERTELSGVTTSNWVAKTANLLVDELDAEPGIRVQLALPTHWLRPVLMLATWAVGGTIVEAGADVFVGGPDEPTSDARHRLASALLPFGAPFPAAPDGFLDLGIALPGQPDAYFAMQDADPPDPAVEVAAMRLTYAELSAPAGSAERVLLTPGTLERDITATLAAAHGGGSMVLVSHATTGDLERLAEQERARFA
ncbi:MAG TPA: TIGR03089 family protein [Aeromicrobium sp.]|nr:TIGR03089 family protein [Aeromicrobium sp.]